MYEITQEQLDKLIALGVDLMVNGACPFCLPANQCGRPWCPYTKEKK